MFLVPTLLPCCLVICALQWFFKYPTKKLGPCHHQVWSWLFRCDPRSQIVFSNLICHRHEHNMLSTHNFKQVIVVKNDVT
jgi:hypothetical protein